MPAKRTKLAPGIWRDKHGISVVVRTVYEYAEERFPFDTELGKLKRRRDALRVLLRDRALAAGAVRQPARQRRMTTLADEVPVYLKARAAMTTIEERELQLS